MATQVVGKAELDGLRASKRNLKAKLERKEDKLKQLKTLISTSLQIRPRRARIALTLPNFVELSAREEFSIFSNPVEMVGFQWILAAGQPGYEHTADWLGVVLFSKSPDNYEGPFEFQIDLSFRLFNNAFSAGDFCKEVKDVKMDRTDGEVGLKKITMIHLKCLSNPASGFLQHDGSIQLELDFTVKSATLDHFLKDDQEDSDDEESSHAGIEE